MSSTTTRAVPVVGLLALAVWSAVASGPAPAQENAAGARVDTTVNVFGDTIPTLSGLTVVDVDSLLFAGEGLLLAFEDTIPFAEGTLDTLLVDAPRVTIDEVVRRIGERMEADRYAVREHEFTGLTTLVARDHDDPDRDYTLYESATRFRRDADGTFQWATVWERERNYEEGELEEEKVEDEIEVDWESMSNELATTTPFSLQSGATYRYEILDRKLVGTNLVYKMRFAPKDPFAALPSGTVWVDYSDWVIRRVEAEMAGAVPVPMFIESIPVYKLRRAQLGEHWVIRDAYARVELRRLPLIGLPASLEFHWRAVDHVINGVEYPEGGGP